MMAAVEYDALVALLRIPAARVTKTVPLPSSAKRRGPILMFPPNAETNAILSNVGTPIPCGTELEMKPMISLTGHISPLFELMRVTQEVRAHRAFSAVCCCCCPVLL
jgi:hypothetical protein